MTKLLKKKYIYVLIVISMGFFVFSPISSMITLQYIKLPIAMPELLFVPFALLLRNKIKSISIKSRDIVVPIVLIVILLLVGIIYDIFTLVGMLSTSRSWLYLLICINVFRKRNLITSEDLMWLALGSMGGWLYSSLYNYQYLLIDTERNFAATYGAMLSIPLFFSVAMNKKKPILLYIGLSLLVGIVVFAGIRRALAVAVVSLIISFYFSAKSKKNFILYSILTITVVFALGTVMPLLRDYTYNTSSGMYNRIFGRTELYLEGDIDSSDQGRMNRIGDLFDNFIDYTIPRGMVSLQTEKEKGTGIFNDYPLYQLCWMFGWPVTLFIICYFLHILWINRRRYNKNKDSTSMTSVNCLIVMFMLLFLEGTFLTYPYATPITGVLIGRAILNAKSKFKIA